MVQTEQQYKFVYMAIKNYVESQQALIQASSSTVSSCIINIILGHSFHDVIDCTGGEDCYELWQHDLSCQIQRI